MAPIPIPTDSPEVLATDTGFSLWLFDTQFFLPLVMSSAITIAVWRWRFPCMTIKYLDTIVEGIRSLIRIDAQAAHHVDLDLLDVLPNMKAVKDNFQRLQSKLSILKRDGYEHEPRHTHLCSWLSFHCHQLIEIDELYWGFRDIKMKILAAIERERRQQ
ncbi:hypothetical protein Moror_15236 [Moniliophthora roreri MCA 2997]|uniref:Uncharacterized protein n=1 Tax=Moniliophthora roreri (strain MCA 2997) TaxID=1381753 RepID=V2X565_MONRO|nr:hypothetical protein Moror_15236 [Moniliophthora roreri MCA 2997]